MIPLIGLLIVSKYPVEDKENVAKGPVSKNLIDWIIDYCNTLLKPFRQPHWTPHYFEEVAAVAEKRFIKPGIYLTRIQLGKYVWAAET